jgi:hypothetical protein
MVVLVRICISALFFAKVAIDFKQDSELFADFREFHELDIQNVPLMILFYSMRTDSQCPSLLQIRLHCGC